MWIKLKLFPSSIPDVDKVKMNSPAIEKASNFKYFWSHSHTWCWGVRWNSSSDSSSQRCIHSSGKLLSDCREISMKTKIRINPAKVRATQLHYWETLPVRVEDIRKLSALDDFPKIYPTYILYIHHVSYEQTHLSNLH